MGIIVVKKFLKLFHTLKKIPTSFISNFKWRQKSSRRNFSLIQMIKTTNATDELNDKKLPHIALLTNPSGGQVYSSFAISADIKIAEPGAIIGMFSRNEIENLQIIKK